MAAEHLLHLFIGRQTSPDGALLDDVPVRIGEIVARALLFNLMNKPRNLLLVCGRPAENAIENFFDLIFCHGHILPYRTTFGASRDKPESHDYP
jgi:hypothetical protein